MSYTETSTQGWFSRIAESIKGILFGIVLFLGAIPCVFWNERGAVKRAQDLEAGEAAAIEVKASPVDAAHEQKLVIVSDTVKVNETLTDPQFGVTATGAVKLERRVEQYQWVEKSEKKKEKKVGGKEVTTTSYTYRQAWSSSTPKQSSEFKDPDARRRYINPTTLPYKGETFAAKDVAVGDFKLSERAINALGGAKAYAIEAVPDDFKGRATLKDGALYIGDNPDSPVVGDVRVRFEATMPEVVTVAGAQRGGALEPYKAKGMSTDILLVETGKKTKEELFAAAQAANETKTWIIRVVTLLMLIGGLAMVFKPLSVIADVIPLVGSVVGGASTLFAALVGGFIWFFLTAMAWIFARPLIGILLMVVAIGAGVGIVLLAKKYKQQPARL